EETLPDLQSGPAVRRGGDPFGGCRRLHRPGARRRLANGWPRHRRGGCSRCAGFAAVAEEGLERRRPPEAMKRFWQRATVVQQGDGWGISLDGRPVRTPARALLVLSTETLANAIASEWNRVGEKIDSSALPLTGLANAAIDRVAPERENFAAILANYAQGDLTCYRAES